MRQTFRIFLQASVIEKRKALAYNWLTLAHAMTFSQTVMLDYFQALDALESQEDGAWFRLNENDSPG